MVTAVLKALQQNVRKQIEQYSFCDFRSANKTVRKSMPNGPIWPPKRTPIRPRDAPGPPWSARARLGALPRRSGHAPERLRRRSGTSFGRSRGALGRSRDVTGGIGAPQNRAKRAPRGISDRVLTRRSVWKSPRAIFRSFLHGAQDRRHAFRIGFYSTKRLSSIFRMTSAWARKNLEK